MRQGCLHDKNRLFAVAFIVLKALTREMGIVALAVVAFAIAQQPRHIYGEEFDIIAVLHNRAVTPVVAKLLAIEPIVTIAIACIVDVHANIICGSNKDDCGKQEQQQHAFKRNPSHPEVPRRLARLDFAIFSSLQSRTVHCPASKKYFSQFNS